MRGWCHPMPCDPRPPSDARLLPWLALWNWRVRAQDDKRPVDSRPRSPTPERSRSSTPEQARPNSFVFLDIAVGGPPRRAARGSSCARSGQGRAEMREQRCDRGRSASSASSASGPRLRRRSARHRRAAAGAAGGRALRQRGARAARCNRHPFTQLACSSLYAVTAVARIPSLEPSCAFKAAASARAGAADGRELPRALRRQPDAGEWAAAELRGDHLPPHHPGARGRRPLAASAKAPTTRLSSPVS
jgi:hypothetical protein